MGFMTRRNLAQRAVVKAAPVTPKKVVPVKEEPVEEVAEKVNLVTKKEVQSKPFFWLKKVAAENGIEVGDMKTAELRSLLIERLGL